MRYLFLFFAFIFSELYAQPLTEIRNVQKDTSLIRMGAERTEKYLSLLRGKTIAVVANQTSLIRHTHLVDSLQALGIHIKCVFAPEHGFRGDAGAGEHIANATDKKTGLPLISLYGKNKKPAANDLKGVDIVLFDIQDVGVRFYTYISTLHYVMEACAENKIPLIVLDRPNPNGFYVDGPVLEKKFSSFVGIHPVPLVHGMSVAEYALMINGERWLKDSLQCKLTCITAEGYSHSDYYTLPVKPSPNLPNMAAVYLYPSLGLFEGTIVSVGRGTDIPFQVIGYPGFPKGTTSFTPKSIPDAAKNPPYEGKECRGVDLQNFGDMYIKNTRRIYLYWLRGFYESAPDKKIFFNNYFDNLAGTDQLREQIVAGKSEEEIRKSWQDGLKKFKIIRKKYLLYQDFE